jgi:predicted dehydrogenase
MDNGTHLIDLTRWFLGDVESVHGYATNHTWHKPGCEDNGFLVMKNSKGRVAMLHSSWTEWRGYGYRMEIYGTEGYIRFGYPPMYLQYGCRMRNGKMKVRYHLFPIYQMLERIRGWEYGLVETLVRDLRAWANAIFTGSPPPISGYDGLEAVRIAQSVECCS